MIGDRGDGFFEVAHPSYFLHESIAVCFAGYTSFSRVAVVDQHMMHASVCSVLDVVPCSVVLCRVPPGEWYATC